jgi:nicotinamidase/pyrazinamidase
VTEITGKDALIVVDVQVDFVTGALGIEGSERIIEPINTASEAFEHVIVVTDWHPRDHVSFASTHPGAVPGDTVETPYGTQPVHKAHCVQGTEGAELDPRLRLSKAELVFRKGYRSAVDSYGAFYENDQTTKTGLAEYLKARGIERVFMAGLARYTCVMQTALGAARDGFAVQIIDDAAMGTPHPTDESNDQVIAEAGITWVESSDLVPAS